MYIEDFQEMGILLPNTYGLGKKLREVIEKHNHLVDAFASLKEQYSELSESIRSSPLLPLSAQDMDDSPDDNEVIDAEIIEES